MGCNQPRGLDEHDVRIINETLKGTYSYKGSISGLPGIPDSQEDVGGWEEYPEVRREEDWDSDHDGLPTWWETLHGLNPRSPLGDFSDTNGDPDRDGFTHLDDYLAWMAAPHVVVNAAKETAIDLQPLFRGFTKGAVYTASSAGQEIALRVSDNTLYFKPAVPGLHELRITVTDEEGSSMTRSLGVHANTGE